MSITQFIAVNVQHYSNAHLLNLPFINYFGQQILCVGVLISVALLLKIVICHIGGLHDKIIIGFILSGVVCSAMVIITFSACPSFSGSDGMIRDA